MDYPFSNWDNYYNALTEHLSSEYYIDKYPNYYKEQCKYGNNINVQIIAKFIENKHDPQDGLNGLIKSLLIGHKLAIVIKDILPTIIKMFIENGAKINLYMLFEPFYINENYIEDELETYELRGMLVDILVQYDEMKKSIDSYIDWKSIENNYWVNMPNYKTYDYNTLRYMTIKYHSFYLKNIVSI